MWFDAMGARASIQFRWATDLVHIETLSDMLTHMLLNQICQDLPS